MKKTRGMFWVVLGIFLLCYVFRVFEYLVLRTDKTWIGEAVIHKCIGIVIILIVVRILQLTVKEIGFVKQKCFQNLLKGLAFGIAVFIIAYATEILIAISSGRFEALQIYISSYAVNQNVGNETDIIFFVICIVGNIINVIMEEGLFRGVFQKVLENKFSFIFSAVISSALFGLWHMIGPVRNYIDGAFSKEAMIANILMLVITSGLVGFKFALMTKMTGSLYMAMGDHFVNNTIVNILHVVSNTGADEMMFVRITIAQSLSFILVLIAYLVRSDRKTVTQ